MIFASIAIFYPLSGQMLQLAAAFILILVMVFALLYYRFGRNWPVLTTIRVIALCSLAGLILTGVAAIYWEDMLNALPV